MVIDTETAATVALRADRPWLAQYGSVPATLAPYPNMTLVDLLRATAGERPGHPALIFKGARVGFGDLDRATDALARSLAARGVRPGDRVALLMPDSPQAVIAQFGAWKSGAIVTPLNPLYTDYELERALAECGAETVVALTPFYGKLKRIQPRTAVRTVIATNVKEPGEGRPLEIEHLCWRARQESAVRVT